MRKEFAKNYVETTNVDLYVLHMGLGTTTKKMYSPACRVTLQWRSVAAGIQS